MPWLLIRIPTPHRPKDRIMESTEDLARRRMTELAGLLPQSAADPFDLAERGRATARRRRTVATGVGLALAAVISAPVAAVTLDEAPSSSQMQADDGRTTGQGASVGDGVSAERGNGTEPCAGMARVAPSQLDSGPVPVVVPELDGHELAVTGAGLCQGSTSRPVVLLGRDAGEIDAWIFYEAGQVDRAEDYQGWFEGLVRTWGGEVVPISGTPAYVSIAEAPGSMNQVLVPTGANVLARIQSAGTVDAPSAADLLDVAKNLSSTE